MPYRYNPFSGQLDLVDTTVVPDEYANQYVTDSGTAIPAAHILNVLGDATQGTATSGSSNTLTITALDASTSQKGTIEIATDAETIAGASSSVAVVPSSLSAKLGTQTQYAVPYGNTTSGAIQWTSAATDGQLVIGATGAAPAFASLTSTGGTITFTASANGLNLEAAGSVAITFDADSGSATPALNVITFSGGNNCTTSAAGSTVTIDVDANVADSFPTDSGTATPALGALTVAGGTLLGTTGAGSTVTVNADDNVVGSIATDSGTVTPSSNSFTATGGTLIGTTGAAATLTINADDNVVGSVATDSGTCTPSSNSFTITGSGGITTSGSGSTVTIIGTSEQVVPVTLLTHADSTYTVLTSDYYLSCDVSGGVLQLNLPNAPTTGSIWIVKDSGGDAAASNITVTTVGGVVTIDGSTSFVMNTAYEAAQFLFNGTSYEVF